MTTSPESPLWRQVRHELEAIRGKWGWFLALGIALILLGTIAIVVPALMTLTTVVFFGILFLIVGIAESIGAFWARDWSGFFVRLLAGLLYLLLGVLFVISPVESAAALTLVLAAFLMIGGVFRVVAALSYRFPGWGWLLVSGLVAILLGILIVVQWPDTAYWVIGLIVGIDMIFDGWWWVMIALAMRKLPRSPAT